MDQLDYDAEGDIEMNIDMDMYPFLDIFHVGDEREVAGDVEVVNGNFILRDDKIVRLCIAPRVLHGTRYHPYLLHFAFSELEYLVESCETATAVDLRVVCLCFGETQPKVERNDWFKT